jgi:hypothetical protein
VTVDEIPLEASPEDVMEQRRDLLPDDVDPESVAPRVPGAAVGTAGWDADPADLADQLAEVPLDDDWA